MYRLLLIGALGACVQTSSVTCDDGLLCPAGTICRTVTNEQVCATQDQIDACIGKAPFDLCPLGALARCYDGVCLEAGCGNNRTDPDEVCDDGNALIGDGCSSECQSSEVCGNEIVDPVAILDGIPVPNEQCDDANVIGRDGCSSDCADESARWEQLVIGKPNVRYDAAIAYDSARRRVVLFGGAIGLPGQMTTLGDTWEWDGAGWSLVRTPVAPSARTGASMAYDAIHRRIILYGGSSSGAPAANLDDTWEFDGARWALLAPASVPRSRSRAATVYDAARDRIVMFGGIDENQTALDETWEWDGLTWTQLAATVRPAARFGAVMAYDAKRAKIVMAGGDAQDTWELDAAGWHDVTPANAGDRTDLLTFFSMAFDPVGQQVILFGGRTATTSSTDTWGWDGAKWTKLLAGSPSVPRLRIGQAMIGDPASGNVLLFGGAYTAVCITFCMISLDDSWVWNGSTWSEVPVQAPPPVRQSTASAFDTARGRLVIFGGEDDLLNHLGDTWELAAGHWYQPPAGPAPTPRAGAAMAFDAARNVVVLFGGEDNADYQADTWTWNGSQWSPLTPAASPPPRKDAAMAYDPVRGRIVLFGGYKYEPTGPGARNDTWEWDGTTWTPMTPATSPSPRFVARAVFDPIRRHIVLAMGRPDYGASDIRETWEWDGTTWTKIGGGPPSRSSAAIAWNAPRGRVELFGGRSGIFVDLNDTWELVDATWTQVVPDALPSPRSGHTLSQTADGSGLIAFGGASGSSTTADVWRLRWSSLQTYELCTVDVDHDGDDLTGCLDPDCWSACSPLCPPGATCESSWPRCGDGTCNAALENCHLCPQDCSCTAVCGDNFCDPPESAASCPGDC